MKPTGQMTVPLTYTAIQYINDHVDIVDGKIIMSYSITKKIMEGDFAQKEVRECFAQKGDFKLSLKKFIMFPLYQELSPDDPHDKAGHFYTVCINTEKQRI